MIVASRLIGVMSARICYEMFPPAPERKISKLKSANDYYDILDTNASDPSDVKIWFFGESSNADRDASSQVIPSYWTGNSVVLGDSNFHPHMKYLPISWRLRDIHEESREKRLMKSLENLKNPYFPNDTPANILRNGIIWLFRPFCDGFHNYNISRLSDNHSHSHKDLRRAIEIAMKKYDRIFVTADQKINESVYRNFRNLKYAVVVPKE